MAIEQAQRQEYAKQFGQLVARTWSDTAFKARLLADPAAVLAQEGIPVPPGMEVRVHEDSPTLVHLALPPQPSAELADALADQASLGPSGPRYLQLAARAWADPAFKARLLAEPAAALAEQGIEYPPGVAVEVHENTPTAVHLTLPPKPSEELSDEQLDQVAGGDTWGCASTASSIGCLTTTAGTALSAGTASSVG
jgi:hypothetical protein